MKEKLFYTKITKQIISIIIALSLIFTLININAASVYAAKWVEIDLGGKHFWYDPAYITIERLNDPPTYIRCTEHMSRGHYTGSEWAPYEPCNHMSETEPHTHGSWEYSASGATLAAECKSTTGTCELPNHKVSLTLSASDEDYSGNRVPATLENATAWSDAGLTTTPIYYVGRDGTEYAETNFPPKEVGKYTAKITAGGETASVNFEIKQKSDGGDAGGTSDTSRKVQVPTDKEKKNFGKGSLVSTPKELLSAIELTKEEKDAMIDNVNLNIWTEITKQEASSIKDADKQKITAKLPATYSVGTYLDIILKAQLDQQGSEERIITKTNKKIRIKLTVPTELQKAGRTYDIIRLHDGEATVLGITREGYDLTFETDGFSTYALIYSDAAPAPASAPTAPKTGDTSNMPLVMLILAMGVVGLGFTSRKKIAK